jgi:hypothetical protein
MTAVPVSVYRPLTRRFALRLGRALIAWGVRPFDAVAYAERVARVEHTRDAAIRTFPQLRC